MMKHAVGSRGGGIRCIMVKVQPDAQEMMKHAAGSWEGSGYYGARRSWEIGCKLAQAAT